MMCQTPVKKDDREVGKWFSYVQRRHMTEPLFMIEKIIENKVRNLTKSKNCGII